MSASIPVSTAELSLPPLPPAVPVFPSPSEAGPAGYATEADVPAAFTRAEVRGKKPNPVRIAFLDCESDHQKDLVEALKKEGFEVIVAFCWPEAVRYLRRGHVDFVLLRAGFMNAAGVARALHTEPSRRPVPVLLLCEREGGHGALFHSLRPRLADFVSAPWHAGELAVRIRVALERQEQERAMWESVDDPLMLAGEGGEILFSTAAAEHVLSRVFGPAYVEKFAQALREARDGIALGGQLRLRVRRQGRSVSVVRLEEEPGSAAAALQVLGLTRREAEILYWVSQGKTSPEVGVILGISADTVKKHVNVILGKLGVETRTAAAMQAMRVLAQGMSRPPDSGRP